MSTTWNDLAAALDRAQDSGQEVELWLRDDDAVAPSAALERLLALSTAHAVPLTLAVIPAATGAPLAARLDGQRLVRVAAHGFAHTNHAPADEKKQELGPHRPTQAVLGELARGLGRLRALHGGRVLPLLVPPWNRIDAQLVAQLPAAGFEILSTFGPPRPAPLRVLNSTVDIIDWHGSRGGRDPGALLAEILAQLTQSPRRPIGLLTHHLVHDAAAWAFLERLLAVTAGHPASRWRDVSALAPPPSGAPPGAARR